MKHPLNHCLQWLVTHHGKRIPAPLIKKASDLDWRIQNREEPK